MKSALGGMVYCVAILGTLFHRYGKFNRGAILAWPMHFAVIVVDELHGRICRCAVSKDRNRPIGH